ncbi:MAG TPA: T9SS type A sorting domain-containing protein, partial [Candidatus Eisenbacteria bacterium]|nr:T9SS type A sorting domain-containing protein [Candidatus Eisenbacteria bacterium]
VSVLLGNGDGSFGPKTDFSAGMGPHSVAVGDLNRDGKPDLAVANCFVGEGVSTVSVLLGRGDGTFPHYTQYQAGYSPTTAAIGDLNGDSKPDLAVVNYGYTQDSPSSISVLLGRGDGSFGTKTDYQTGDYPNSAEIADLDGDGHLELIVANYISTTVSVLRDDSHGGLTVTSFAMGYYPYSLAIGDLNGDGKPDLATANTAGPGMSTTTGVSVVLGNGDGTFGVETRFGTGSYPQFVAIGDLNGDGKLDLAVANQGYYEDEQASISVLLGNGDGNFGGRTDYTPVAGPTSVAIGDLNADGRLDLAVTNSWSNTVSVLLNTGVVCNPVPMSLEVSPSIIHLQSPGHWVTATLEPEPPASPIDIDIPSILLNGSVPVDASGPTSIGDVDQDGRPDLTVKFDRAAVEATVSEGDSVPVTVTARIGNGCFEATDVIRVIRARVTSPSAGSEVQGGSTAEVRWDTPAGVEVQSVALLFSADDGANWALIARELPNTGSSFWTVPNRGTQRARIATVLVESADEAGFEVNGVLARSERFTITTPPGWVEPGASLALHGAVPNPSRTLNVSFTLPDDKRATLVVYDVSGREVRRQEIGRLGVGRHVVSMGTVPSLAPGIYLIHLIRGDRQMVARAAVIR